MTASAHQNGPSFKSPSLQECQKGGFFQCEAYFQRNENDVVGYHRQAQHLPDDGGNKRNPPPPPPKKTYRFLEITG